MAHQNYHVYPHIPEKKKSKQQEHQHKKHSETCQWGEKTSCKGIIYFLFYGKLGMTKHHKPESSDTQKKHKHGATEVLSVFGSISRPKGKRFAFNTDSKQIQCLGQIWGGACGTFSARVPAAGLPLTLGPNAVLDKLSGRPAFRKER